MGQTSIKDYSMKPFERYLTNLPRTPVTEAVTALYEGLTKSDMALGRYLKSFNKGVKVPPLPQGIKPNERVAYMMLARHPHEMAKLLDIGVTYGIPEDGEEEFDDIAAEIDIQETIKKIAEVTSDRSRGAVRGATAEIVYVYEHLDRKDELKKAADLYRNGQSDAGYTALKDALGEINFEYVVYPIVKLWKSEDAYRDDKLFVLNPDIKSHLIRNRWLIHETSVDAGLSILKNGFDRGNLAGDLGMTTWGKHSQTGDYLFAHDVVDMLSHENYQSRGFGSYGNFALVFQGSGYKAYHDIDEENQVMFDYHEPKAFFVILYRDDAEEAGFPVKNAEYEDYKYAVYGQGKSGAPSVLFANESAYKCLEWILQHGASYRNVMFKVGAPAVTEAVESSRTTVFSTIEELRDYLDRAAYGTFENSEYDQYEQEPYGSLENIQEVGMADFVKDMSEMNHDIQSLVGQPIDDKTLNQLVYDWFVCLHTRGAVGWQYNWN